MRPAKKIQIIVDEEEEEAKSRRSPSPTKRKSIMNTPEPKVIVQQDNDGEMFVSDVPDINFDELNDQ